MDRRQFENHVVILGWLHVGAGAIFAVMGIFVFTFFTGIGVAADDPEAFPVLATVGASVALLLLVLSLPGLLAGFGLLKRRAWARILAIVVGFLQLVNFPIGTAIGAYTLWILFDEQAAEVFPLIGPETDQPPSTGQPERR
jgi:hypothetical protein